MPKRFFGVAPQDATSDADLARMAAGKVGSYHLLLSWAQVETEPGVYDWSSYDELLGSASPCIGIEPDPLRLRHPAATTPTAPSVPPTDQQGGAARPGIDS